MGNFVRNISIFAMQSKHTIMKILQATPSGGKEEFGAWFENLPHVYGSGRTVEEAKQSLVDGLNLYMEECKELPIILKGEYKIAFHF